MTWREYLNSLPLDSLILINDVPVRVRSLIVLEEFMTVYGPFEIRRFEQGTYAAWSQKVNGPLIGLLPTQPSMDLEGMALLRDQLTPEELLDSLGPNVLLWTSLAQGLVPAWALKASLNAADAEVEAQRDPSVIKSTSLDRWEGYVVRFVDDERMIWKVAVRK